MTLFIWNPSYSVNVKEFDTHHKKLISLINKLHSNMMEGRGREVLSEILSELKSYTKYHFQAEEELMQTHNYPHYAEHKKKHDELIKKVSEIEKKFKDGETNITIGTFKFLKSWLVEHIQFTDKKYAVHFNSKGIH